MSSILRMSENLTKEEKTTVLSLSSLQSKNWRPLKCHLCFWGVSNQQMTPITKSQTRPCQARLYKLHVWVWLENGLSLTSGALILFLSHPASFHSLPLSFFNLYHCSILIWLLWNSLCSSPLSTITRSYFPCPLFFIWYDVQDNVTLITTCNMFDIGNFFPPYKYLKDSAYFIYLWFLKHLSTWLFITVL